MLCLIVNVLSIHFTAKIILHQDVLSLLNVIDGHLGLGCDSSDCLVQPQVRIDSL